MRGVRTELTRRSWLGAAGLLMSRALMGEEGEKVVGGDVSRSAVRVRGKSEKQGEVEIVGEIVTSAADGGILVRTGENRLWTFTPEQIVSEEKTGEEFRLWGEEELKRGLRSEFTEPFRIEGRGEFLFCSDASERFLERCGDLFGRLRRGFTQHWEKVKFPLGVPEQKLVVLVFGKREDYQRYATREFDATIAGASGYFSVMQNRIVLYDVTVGRGGVEKVAEQIATIMHEATHQLAFNCGLQRRLADNPLWLTEGLAMYFETPDLESRTGWKKAGVLNRARVRDLLRDLGEHPELALATFLGTDLVFREPRREGGAYGRAWGLFYYLMKQRPAEMVTYLEVISQKPVLVWDSPAERVEAFAGAFGDVSVVEKEVGGYFRRLGGR